MMDIIKTIGPELSVIAACAALGLARATYYRKLNPMHGPAMKKSSPRALPAAESKAVLDVLGTDPREGEISIALTRSFPPLPLETRPALVGSPPRGSSGSSPAQGAGSLERSGDEPSLHARARQAESRAHPLSGTVMGLTSNKVHLRFDVPPLDVKLYLFDIAPFFKGAWLEPSEEGAIL